MRARWDIFFRTARTVKPIQKPSARFHLPCSIQKKSGETLRLQYITPALILQYLLQDFYSSILFWAKRVSNKSENGRSFLVMVRICGTHPLKAFPARAAIRRDGSGHVPVALFRCTCHRQRRLRPAPLTIPFPRNHQSFQTRLSWFSSFLSKNASTFPFRWLFWKNLPFLHSIVRKKRL